VEEGAAIRFCQSLHPPFYIFDIVVIANPDVSQDEATPGFIRHD
jgi:hypothetical protein